MGRCSGRSASSRSARCGPGPRTSFGSRFDIRRFHDVLLAGGSLPLGVLEDEVARFIAAEKAAPDRRR